ncbi:Snf7 family like protein [Aduncisulcus paluster]|uniref:Snf7 family like protein n=1 Tax=Aduncisulcus paluster TaxID=2918883 RepID=A0ABQ5JVJ0_9EUKA|nr:Snf7 family like protein [Aduncisulcus paluster]
MGAGQSKQPMNQDDFMFELKMNSKQLSREATKAKQTEKKYKAKVLECIKQGDRDTAEIHAQSCIRCKREALKLTRLSARMDAVAMQLKSAAVSQKVVHMMAGTGHMLQTAMGTMNMEDLGRIMDKCEEQFEELKVRDYVMDDMMSKDSVTGAPAETVGQFLAAISKEAGLDIAASLGTVGEEVPTVATATEVGKLDMPSMESLGL